jgi:type I restriction enzyme S subunit
MNMNDEWARHKLDELGTVARGRSRHRPRNDPSLYGGPYPFFQTGDVKAAEFRLTDFTQTYSEAGLAQSKIWEPGTLCITIAANIADTAVLGIRGCFPDSIVGFVADPCRCDVRFIKYYIDTIKLSMQNASKGTTQDNLSVDKLLTFEFRVPPLPTQRKIADILSAYDDLIENNTRRIALLEELAQSLYREWFVHFRYPGHADVPLVETPLRPAPAGWVVTTLGAVSLNFDSKRRPLSSMQRSTMKGEFPYYGAAKIFDHINDYIFDGEYLLVAEDGSVITADNRPVLQLADGKFWVNNHTHIIRGRPPVTTHYLTFGFQRWTFRATSRAQLSPRSRRQP